MTPDYRTIGRPAGTIYKVVRVLNFLQIDIAGLYIAEDSVGITLQHPISSGL
jgi:hypothetical protein